MYFFLIFWDSGDIELLLLFLFCFSFSNYFADFEVSDSGRVVQGRGRRGGVDRGVD